MGDMASVSASGGGAANMALADINPSEADAKIVVTDTCPNPGSQAERKGRFHIQIIAYANIFADAPEKLSKH